MFGGTLDYYLLKSLTHNRNIATEEALNDRTVHSRLTLDQAKSYLEKIQTYFKNHIPIEPKLSYLDIGCGLGRFSIGLSLAGAIDVTGDRYFGEAR